VKLTLFKKCINTNIDPKMVENRWIFTMYKVNKLDFCPLIGLSSGHLQTIIGGFRKPVGSPPSKSWHVSLGDGNFLACEVSCPVSRFKKIAVLIHGLGGCHTSNYMVRMAQKLYDKNIMAVRVNLRGCGSGATLSSLPYHGGRSQDLLAVVRALKSWYPLQEIYVIGYSLGANIALKLAGELGNDASKLIKMTIGVCGPLDIGHTVHRMHQRKYSLYHAYFLKKVCEQAKPWLKAPVRSMYEFDNQVIAPLWGFSGAEDYYKNSSSIHYLPNIQHPCFLIFAEDDPFISHDIIKAVYGMPVQLFVTKHGGHMGFLGKTTKEHNFHWLDQQLFAWIES
jgi:predicted alpha/beta-fold hydrolase